MKTHLDEGLSQRIVVTLGCPTVEPALAQVGLLGVPTTGWSDCKVALQRPNVRALLLRIDGDANQLHARVRQARSETSLVDVIVWAPNGSPEDVRESLRGGAADVILADNLAALSKAVLRIIDRQRFLPRLQRFELARSRSARFEGLISKSARMWELFETVTQVAPSGATVLILGETGVGKELLARAIHKYSSRPGRFVPVNCGGIPEPLIDSELFGHEEGTFTGATRSKKGLFRTADGGTLFLDEVGNLPLVSQYSFLRALQEEAVRPVGGHGEIPVDTRVIAATSESLDEVVRDGLFREDLLFRLDVIRLVIPPLRERPEDILHLFGFFRRKLAKHYRLEAPHTTDSFLEALLAYDWPGNVRELENLAERLVLTHHGKRITDRQFESLKRPYRRPAPRPKRGTSDRLPSSSMGSTSIDLEKTLQETTEPVVDKLERRYLEAALRANGGRIAETAQVAGISPRTLLRKLKQHGVDKREFRGPAKRAR